MGIEGCLKAMPGIPQVLVFDTAFHTTMPEVAWRYAISYDMAEKYHIRRYGAHGTSHHFVAREMIKLLDKPVEETKIITCHIGNGSSISAVKGGKCKMCIRDRPGIQLACHPHGSRNQLQGSPAQFQSA